MDDDGRWPDAYSYWGGECRREDDTPPTPSPMPIWTMRPQDREKMIIRRAQRYARRLRAREGQ